jgi:GNAT superfamily N-acetyltransferase
VLPTNAPKHHPTANPCPLAQPAVKQAKPLEPAMPTDLSRLTLKTLDGTEDPAVYSAARDFCLQMIRDTYAIDYHPQWHADLDSLIKPAQENWYNAANRGAFCVVYDAGGEMVATGGLHGFSLKPGTAKRLGERYQDHAEICQLVRVYLRPELRGQGLGTRIVTLLEDRAAQLNYRTSYLHADALADATLRFWQRCNYREFGRFSYPANGRTDTSVDFDKPLK